MPETRRVRRRVRRVVAVFGLLVAAGCGGDSSASDDSAPSEVSSTPPEAEAPGSTTPSTTEGTTTTTEPPPDLGEADLVAVSCDGGSVSVSAVDAATETLTPVYEVAVPGELNCGRRATFSTDFSTALFTLEDPVSGNPHIAVIDLGTGELIDLSAPREGDGSFSDTPLQEGGAVFLGESSSTLVFGSEQVVFQRADEATARSTTVADPTVDAVFREIEVDLVTMFERAADHQELAVQGWTSSADVFGENKQTISNPGGTLLSAYGTTWPTVWPVGSTIADGVELTPADTGCEGQVLGWIDDQRLALYQDYATGRAGRGGNLQIATVAADGGSATCGGNLIPESTKTVGPGRLTLDRSSVEFTAGEPGSGDERWYSVPLTGGEPTEVGGAPLPVDLYLYEY